MIVKKEQVQAVNMMPGVDQYPIWGQDTGAGSVTMGRIVIQPGVSLKPHYHLVEDAMIVIAGRGAFVVEGEEFPVTAGDGMLAPANKWHFIRNDGNEPMEVVYTWPSVHVARMS